MLLGVADLYVKGLLVVCFLEAIDLFYLGQPVFWYTLTALEPAAQSFRWLILLQWLLKEFKDSLVVSYLLLVSHWL